MLSGSSHESVLSKHKPGCVTFVTVLYCTVCELSPTCHRGLPAQTNHHFQQLKHSFASCPRDRWQRALHLQPTCAL
jgi:hypothetical protein